MHDVRNSTSTRDLKQMFVEKVLINTKALPCIARDLDVLITIAAVR